MANLTPKDELIALHGVLMPVLSQAAVGNFSSEVEIDPANSREVNEILMGVEVLLETIREKIAELEAAGEASGLTPRNAPGQTTLLDEVLKNPAE